MADVYLKTGDTAPAFSAQLLDGDQQPVDLTGATVRFTMRPIDDPTAEPTVDREPCVVDDATTGRVHYNWQTADTAVAAEYYGEFEATLDGHQLTFPSDVPGFSILIVPALA